MRRFIAAMCGATFLFFSISALPAPNPVAGQPDKTQSQLPILRGTKDAPIFVEGALTTQRSEHQSKWEREESSERAANEHLSLGFARANLIFTGLLFAAALGQIALFWWQLSLISSSATEAKAAANAAQTSAEAAKAQAEALVIAQRAWVFYTGVESGRFTDGEADGKKIPSGMWFAVQWSNTGNTPALHTDLYRDGRIVDKSSPVPTFTPHAPPDRNSSESRSATVAPHFSFKSNLFVLTDQEVEKLKRREARFFLFGRATYRDMFDGNQLRVTDVCLNVEYDGEVILPDGQRQARIAYTPVGPQNTAS